MLFTEDTWFEKLVDGVSEPLQQVFEWKLSPNITYEEFFDGESYSQVGHVAPDRHYPIEDIEITSIADDFLAFSRVPLGAPKAKTDFLIDRMLNNKPIVKQKEELIPTDHAASRADYTFFQEHSKMTGLNKIVVLDPSPGTVSRAVTCKDNRGVGLRIVISEEYKASEFYPEVLARMNAEKVYESEPYDEDVPHDVYIGFRGYKFCEYTKRIYWKGYMNVFGWTFNPYSVENWMHVEVVEDLGDRVFYKYRRKNFLAEEEFIKKTAGYFRYTVEGTMGLLSRDMGLKGHTPNTAFLFCSLNYVHLPMKKPAHAPYSTVFDYISSPVGSVVNIMTLKGQIDIVLDESENVADIKVPLDAEVRKSSLDMLMEYYQLPYHTARQRSYLAYESRISIMQYTMPEVFCCSVARCDSIIFLSKGREVPFSESKGAVLMWKGVKYEVEFSDTEQYEKNRLVMGAKIQIFFGKGNKIYCLARLRNMDKYNCRIVLSSIGCPTDVYGRGLAMVAGEEFCVSPDDMGILKKATKTHLYNFHYDYRTSVMQAKPHVVSECI